MAGITIPAFGFSQSMTRPVNKSPLDTARTHSGVNFAGDAAADRSRRIQDFSAYTGAHPGAAVGGTGDTGLNASDASGWSNLLERQQQNLKDLAAQDGKAGPNVRVGAYDGSHLSDSDSGPLPAPAPRGRAMAPNAAGPAMKGLSDVLGGGGGGRLPQIISDDPIMYKAYENMLLDQMQGAGRSARMTALAPGDVAMLNGDTRVRDAEAGDRQFEREQGDLDTMQGAATKYHAWNGYGKAQAADVNELAGELADRKGVAAVYDDQIRVGGQLGVAGINAGVQDRRTQAQAAMNGLNVAQRNLGNQRQFGTVDPNAQQQFDNRLQAAPMGVGGGAGAAAAGPPEQEIQAAMRARGWSREQAIQMWRARQGVQ